MTKKAIGFIVQKVACGINYPITEEQEVRSSEAVKILWQKLVECEAKENKGE